VQVHYRRQLEYMMRRLYVNEVAYDAHLNAMEVAMGALQKESAQVRQYHLCSHMIGLQAHEDQQAYGDYRSM
jgi:hypothetical protein